MEIEEKREFHRDLTCFIIACMIHGVVLSRASGLSWSGPPAPPINVLPVEFVKEIPKSPFLAPILPGNGRRNAKPGHGQGPVQRKKIKRGSPLVPKQVKRPGLPKARITHHSDLLSLKPLSSGHFKLQAPMMRTPTHHLTLSANLTGSHLQARLSAAHMKAAVVPQMTIHHSSMNMNTRQLKVEQTNGDEILNQKTGEMRQNAARSMEQGEARTRQALAADAQQSRSRQRADVEGQLASLSSPDEGISNGDGGGGLPAGGGRGGRGAAGAGDAGGLGGDDGLGGPANGGGGISAGAGEGQTVFDSDGRGGRDSVNSPASGGGVGDGGGPVSWALMGAAGNRRLLRRVVPPCPDWVSERGLDLIVQLKFRVLDDGTIKEGVLIQKTSGFPDLDQQAIAALRRWKFQAYRHAPNVRSPEVWGVVKFHFVAA